MYVVLVLNDDLHDGVVGDHWSIVICGTPHDCGKQKSTNNSDYMYISTSAERYLKLCHKNIALLGCCSFAINIQICYVFMLITTIICKLIF